MTPMQTILLTQRITTARVAEAEQGRMEPAAANPQSAIRNPQSEDLCQQVLQQREELARLLATVHSLVDGLYQLQEQTLAGNRVEIARLAVEIARKILRYQIGKGDYEIQAIVEEALKEAPTRQKIVLHLHPEDVSRCQQLQREDPQGPLAELELTADGSVGRGECLVQTPKGIVKSFIEEHLDRIREALERME